MKQFKLFFFFNSVIRLIFRIDLSMYYKASSFFDLFFMNCSKPIFVHDVGICHVCNIEEKSFLGEQIKESDILIDLDSKTWMFDFFVDMEDYLAKILLNYTVGFHGGGVEYQNQAVLFLGKRYSGKSTLISKLLLDDRFKYLDDDVIMINERQAWGMGFPLKSREPNDQMQMKCRNDVDKYLTNYKLNTELIHIKSIVFPTYNPEKGNKFVQIKGTESFVLMFDNLKFGKTKAAVKNIINLCESCNIYLLEYSNDDYLNHALGKIILA